MAKKNLVLGPILVKFGLPNFFSKIWLRQLLDVMVNYHHVQYKKKIMIRSWETDRRTDRETDKSDFIRRCPSNVGRPKTNITNRARKVDEKNGVICLVSFILSWVIVLKLPKLMHFFCKFVLTSSKNLNLLKQFIYIHLKDLIMLLQRKLNSL